MLALTTQIPDVDVLLGLEPEELASKVLFLLKGSGRFRRDQRFHALFRGVQNIEDHPYPPRRHDEIAVALVEAWVWLEVQGLIIPDPSVQEVDWQRLSRKAEQFQQLSDFTTFAITKRLPRDTLHPRLQRRAYMAFIRNEYDVAVFLSMKAVEVIVRTHAPAFTGEQGRGYKLMMNAFKPHIGPLSDATAEPAEQEGLRDLFAGAMRVYRNPFAHRDIDLDDANEAIEIILFANHMLKIVERRVKTP